MGAGGQATLTTTRQGGELKANLEIQVPSPLCSASCQATLVLLLIIGGSAALATEDHHFSGQHEMCICTADSADSAALSGLLRLENPKGLF